MNTNIARRAVSVAACLLLPAAFSSALPAAEAWEKRLKTELAEPYYSQTRHLALRQVDTSGKKGLDAIWNFCEKIAPKDPLRYDWYVKEGAYEALMNAKTKESYEEIVALMEKDGYERSKEAVIYSIVRKIRKQFDAQYKVTQGEMVDVEKDRLRKERGIKYYKLLVPVLRKVDRKKRRLELIHTAFQDKSQRVRLAAIQGYLAYPNDACIPLLLDNLKRLEKKKEKNYREWVFTRHALERLTGQYYRDDVEGWFKWWDIVKDDFSIEGRIKNEAADDDEKKPKGKTKVVNTGGVSVTLNMKVVGDGYPLLVLPQSRFKPDYFRPYFHGVEEFMKVHYVQIPKIGDFKGLKRHTGSNLIVYPTELLAEALAKLMEESELEKYAILGHGTASSTLAMYMVAKFPDAVTHLIMINPASAGKEYGRAIDNVERLGRELDNKELQNGAKNLRITGKNEPQYKPADAAEAGGLGRALGNVNFADPSSPEIGNMNFLHRGLGGSQTMNDQSWSIKKIFSGKPPRLPVMVVIGEKDPWSPIGDVQKVASSFRGSYVARFKRSALYPFMFETYRFTQTLRGWCAKNGIKSARPQKKK